MFLFSLLTRRKVRMTVGGIALCLLWSVSLTGCGRHGLHQKPSTGSLPDAAGMGRLKADSVCLYAVDDTPVCSLPLDAPAPSWPYGLQQGLDSLLCDSLFASTQVGLCVHDLTDDVRIYAFNARHRLRPASTEKMITAVSALSLLGGNYSFQTGLYVTGTVTRGVLRGDVYVRGGFDPCLGRDELQTLVAGLKKAGVDSVAGRCYADVSMKDTLKWGWGWCWDDDNPTLTPLLYDGTEGFREAWFAELARQDVAVSTTEMDVACCPSKARCTAVCTQSVDRVLLRMMKESDNLYAEALFYQLAARGGRRYASRRQAVQEIQDLIAGMGLNPADYQIADGSGLSLYNYLTPELEVAFLRHAYRSDDVYNHLYPALPVAGQDGTLKKRMTSGPACMNVHAKTGTVEGVSALAGYATASNGHLLAFSIMNQGVTRARLGRDFQDKVCTLLCR